VVAGIGGASFIRSASAGDQQGGARPTQHSAQTFALAPATTLIAEKAPKDEGAPRRPLAAGGGINSVAAAPPVVVKTVPQAGADDVDPALTEIKVTFSKEMIDGNWSFPQISKETAVKSTGKPHFEDEGRTCVLPVKLEPGKTYVIPLNKKPFDSFMDKDQRRAMEYLLVFETKKE
jgi:RNA polymerase sigma-70 factor (ECF subfamily)